jgi:hypothetical protein
MGYFDCLPSCFNQDAVEDVMEEFEQRIIASIKKQGLVNTLLEHSDEIDFHHGGKNLSNEFGKWLMADPELHEKIMASNNASAFLADVKNGGIPDDHRGDVSHKDFQIFLRNNYQQFAFSHDTLKEGDGSPVICLDGAVFKNWGRTVTNTPALTCCPTSKDGVRAIIKFASNQGKQVRCSGYRHSWSDIFSTDDAILISLLPVETVTKLPATEPLMNPQNELMGIEMIGTIEENSQKFGLCKIGAATTNEMFRRWALATLHWTLPLNVIMVEITFGGSNAPICHGAGINHRTLSDLVYSIELVNARGELQVIDDPEELKAASGCFGLLGVVTSLTLKLEKMSFANMKPTKIPTVLAVPPLPGTNIPPHLQPSKKPTPTELLAATESFIARARDDYYSEWFWFVFQKECWVNTWKNDGDFKDARDYPKPGDVISQNLQEYVGQVTNEWFVKHPFVANLVQTQMTAGAAMLIMPNIKEGDKPIVTPVIDALHFRRGIQNMRVRDMEFEIPIPAKADGSPDWSICQKAWWDVINIVYDYEKNEHFKNKRPMRLTMEMRITGGSDVIMAPQNGNNLGTCSIEVLTPANVSNDLWQRFIQDVVDKWATYTDLEGNPLNIRPHWAKEWKGIKVRGKPIETYLREDAYSDKIPDFKKRLEKIAGGKLGMFNNPLLDRLFSISSTS